MSRTPVTQQTKTEKQDGQVVLRSYLSKLKLLLRARNRQNGNARGWGNGWQGCSVTVIIAVAIRHACA